MAQAGAASTAGASWTQRLYEALPLAPAWVGVAIFAGLSALFAASEIALGRHRALEADAPDLRDIRLAFLNFLLLAYAPTAWLYVLRGTRRRLDALLPLFDPSDDEVHRRIRACGRYSRAARWSAGLGGVAIALVVPLLTQGSEDAYRPSHWSAEVVWHRITAPLIGWWVAQLLLAMIAESARFSGLARRLPSLDLLDLRPLAPFARQGLANALAGAILVAILALSLLEADFGAVFALAGGASLAACALGLFLPVRGVHRRIREVKQAELDWLHARLHSARSALAEDAASPRASVSELLAWHRHVESIPEWPFDAPTLRRAILYLLIPLGSWAGAAFVERALDALLAR